MAKSLQIDGNYGQRKRLPVKRFETSRMRSTRRVWLVCRAKPWDWQFAGVVQCVAKGRTYDLAD